MDISIIVPVYNVEKYLSRCLDSLLNQDCDISYEVLCINDASPDNSEKILKEYATHYPNIIKVFNNPNNLGLGASRDVGVSLASGSYLMFIDSDDTVKHDYIKTYYDNMINDPCDVLVGGYVDVHKDRNKEHFIPASEWSQLSFVSACSKLFNRDFFIKNSISFSKVRYAEDMHMSLALFAMNPKTRFIKYAGYCYYYNPESITHHNVYDKNYETILSQIFEDFLTKHDIDNLDKKNRYMLEYAYISHMLNILLMYNRGCGWKRMKDKYSFFMQDLNQKFPDFKNNPFIGFFRPKGQRSKVRIGMGGFRLAEKLHISKVLFWVASH